MSRNKTAPPIAGAHGAARKTIKILVVEDSEPDAELTMRALQNAGIDAQYERVQSAAAVQAALRRQAWDAVIADFNLPGFTGMDVLGMVRSAGLDIPFIIVSGAIGEDIAVEAMRHGADDYLLKDRLSRLGPALTRALGRKRLRDEAGRAAEALRESMAGLDRAQVMAGLAHVITGPDGSFESWSATLPALIGVQSAQMPKSTRAWLDILHPDDRAKFRDKAIEAGVAHARRNVEYRMRRADGAWIHVRQVMEPLGGQTVATEGGRWFNSLQDVTDQKQADERIRRLNRVYAVLSGINALIVRVHDRDELFRESCRITVQSGQFPLAFVAVADPRDRLLKAVAWAGDERGFVHLTRPMGYPMAYAIARASRARRNMLLMMVILPFWTSLLLRVYAWIGILKNNGLINNFLMWSGVIDQPIVMMQTDFAIYVGIVYSYLPFMILPLYSNLTKMDLTLLEAAEDLGCGPFRAFLTITLPLSMPGVIAGCLLVFIPAVGEFVIPALLGGPDTLMIGKVLWTEFFNNRDWPVASAVAIALLALLLAPIVFLQRTQRTAAKGPYR